MIQERFNDVLRIIDDYHRYLKPFTCETSLEKETPVYDLPIIFHLVWLPCTLVEHLLENGFSSTAFPEDSGTLGLWVRDLTIHYNSTPKV